MDGWRLREEQLELGSGYESKEISSKVCPFKGLGGQTAGETNKLVCPSRSLFLFLVPTSYIGDRFS